MDMHQVIWSAIDELAQRKEMSIGGLARISGLDPTSLSHSKRFTRGHKPRWPSFNTLGKIFAATQISFREFADIMQEIQDANRPRRRQSSENQ